MPSSATSSKTEGSKKRKRYSPFRIKVGCVVALRYKPSTGNHVTMIVPPPRESTEQSTSKPTKHPLHCLVGTDSHVEVWTDPTPGRDEGLALIGRRIRCYFKRETRNENSSSNGVSTATTAENGKHPPATKNIMVEGEVVSISSYGNSEWMQSQESAKRQRNTSVCGTDVELLIDREMLAKVSFLERADEDVDVNSMKKESAKRAHKNEEAIKGKNKVTVKVTLADMSGIVDAKGREGMSHKSVARWVIRKRIPNQPGEPILDTLNNQTTNGTGKEASSSGDGSKKATEAFDGQAKGEGKTAKKVNGSKKAPTPPTQFMGNKNDDAKEQQRNWRWFAERFHDLYLENNREESNDPAAIVGNRNTIPFLEHYSDLLACCGGFVGEVLEVTPSSKGGTLAMVTLRRLILPQHTSSGGGSILGRDKGRMEVFDDYDSTLIGRQKKPDGNEEEVEDNKNDEGPSSVVFRVPIEELVIVSRSVKRQFQNQAETSKDGMSADELAIVSSYSWKADCFVPLKHMVPKQLDGETPVPRPLTKKKLKKVSLCHRCRRWLPNKQVAVCDNPNCAVTRYLATSTEEREDNPISVGWCKLCMDNMRGIESIIDQDFSEDNLQALGDLPCCLGLCDCRRCDSLVCQQKTEDDFLAALENAHANNTSKPVSSGDKSNDEAETDNSLFRDTTSMLKTMPTCDFDIPAKYIDLQNLPLFGSKLITKNTRPQAKKGAKANSNAGKAAAKSSGEKRKGDTPPAKKAAKKAKATTPRPGTPPPPSPKPQKAPRRTSEDYSVFKPTCSRLMDYEAITAAKAKRNASDEERVLSGKLVSGDKPRNLREVYEKKRREETGKKVEKDEKVLSSRAARANQRRLVKDVALLGASSLNLDTLAGRESQLRFDRSGIHGWGVFADVDISAGDMIVEYRGVNIGNAMAEKREREYELAKIGSDYMFRIDGLTVCDATKQGNVARFINASCDPNCYTKIITLDGKQRIVIYAKKDIKVGEELCYDYKFELEQDESKRIPCCCGSPECKGFMNWDKKLG